MTDDELIKQVASIWVANGGDAEGLDYSYKKLRYCIEEMSKINKKIEEMEEGV